MNVTLIGTMVYNFKNGDGEQVSGKKFFCTYEDEKINGEGCLTFSLSPKNSFYQSPVSVGDNLRLYYNRYGKVDSFDVV